MNESTITSYPDGPLLVRGPITLLDAEGVEIVVDRPTIALCRCGNSRNQPLCDGTHGVTCFRVEARSMPNRAEGSDDAETP
jgi:CDGSH-type Zn-finger protein